MEPWKQGMEVNSTDFYDLSPCFSPEPRSPNLLWHPLAEPISHKKDISSPLYEDLMQVSPFFLLEYAIPSHPTHLFLSRSLVRHRPHLSLSSSDPATLSQPSFNTTHLAASREKAVWESMKLSFSRWYPDVRLFEQSHPRTLMKVKSREVSFPQKTPLKYVKTTNSV